MLNKLKKQDSEGFTIIEVMIVLAIAGLILIIVLLAVPALQRNSRNTAIKSDANQVVGYVNDYISNNDGALPDVGSTTTITDGTVTLDGSEAGKISSKETMTITDDTSDTEFSNSTLGTLKVVLDAKCGTPDGATATVVSANRAFAVVYPVEGSGSITAKCVGS